MKSVICISIVILAIISLSMGIESPMEDNEELYERGFVKRIPPLHLLGKKNDNIEGVNLDKRAPPLYLLVKKIPPVHLLNGYKNKA